MMKINKKFSNDIEINMSLDNKVYIISDDSATGKSFLFKLLRKYCSENHIKYLLLDYNDLDKPDFSDDFVVSQCSMYDLVALDNADLYMNPDLFKRLNGLGNIILISIKDEFLMFPFHMNDKFDYNYEFVDVFFERNKIEVI